MVQRILKRKLVLNGEKRIVIANRKVAVKRQKPIEHHIRQERDGAVEK